MKLSKNGLQRKGLSDAEIRDRLSLIKINRIDKEYVSYIKISREISPIRKIKVTSEDGDTIKVVMRKPPGNGFFPAIIIIHGGMSERKIDRRIKQISKGPLCTRLLALGYVVVFSTFRTYVNNSRDQGPISDNVAVIDYVKKLHFVERKSVAVLGHSGGARLALELSGLGERTDLAAIVCAEPATTLYAEMYPEGMKGPNYEVCGNHEKYFTNKNRKILRKKVIKISCPTMILHSDIHPINDVNNTYLIPEMRAQGKNIQTTLYPGLHHGFIWGQGESGVTEEIYERIVNDIKDYLYNHLNIKPNSMSKPETKN
jgi:dienelactone hydrolase